MRMRALAATGAAAGFAFATPGEPRAMPKGRKARYDARLAKLREDFAAGERAPGARRYVALGGQKP